MSFLHAKILMRVLYSIAMLRPHLIFPYSEARIRQKRKQSLLESFMVQTGSLSNFDLNLQSLPLLRNHHRLIVITGIFTCDWIGLDWIVGMGQEFKD